MEALFKWIQMCCSIELSSHGGGGALGLSLTVSFIETESQSQPWVPYVTLQDQVCMMKFGALFLNLSPARGLFCSQQMSEFC